MSESFGVETVSKNAADFREEFAYSVAVSPWNALVQVADKIPAINLPQIQSPGPEHKDSLGGKAGELVGFVLDFTALSLATKGLCKPFLRMAGIGETSALSSATTLGLAGGLYGGVFTPTERAAGLLHSRLDQAAIQAGTFAAMSLSTSAMSGTLVRSLSHRVGINVAGGAIGGGVNAILTERLMNDRFASLSEIAQQARTFATFGAVFAGIDHGLGKIVSTGLKSSGAKQYPDELTETLTPFQRLSNEPILGPRAGKFDAAGAFNPAATRLPNGDVAILYRAQDLQGVSTVGYARTGPDGVAVQERSNEPVLAPRAANEHLGIEDPRLTADPVNPQQWELTATKWDGKDAQLADWTSPDLKNWDERGIMMAAKEGTWNTWWVKSGSIVSREVEGKFIPEKINGKFWMYYMGTRAGIDEMGLSSSVDGKKWTDATSEPVLPVRPGQFDSHLVEPGPPAIVTRDGINLIYSGGMPYEGSNGMYKYQTGLAVFSKDDPTRLLYRADKPLFSPETPWEKANSSSSVHQVPNVVFPQGIVPDGKGSYLIYYGAADSYVGVARTKFQPVNRLQGISESLRQSFLRSPAALTSDNRKSK